MEIKTQWKCALELDSARKIVSGSATGLADAIRRGADLRIYTGFRHNEHIDVTSSNPEIVKEVAEFAVTYLVKDSWSAGVMTLRQPIELPLGFGPRPSMSFFLYNQDGQQAIARPFLDGATPKTERHATKVEAPDGMTKYHLLDSLDDQTNAPSSNFIYDFERFRYCVWDGWQEVFSHDDQGAVRSGSLDSLISAFVNGCEIKVGVRGLCRDVAQAKSTGIDDDHELFVRVGPGYYYTQQRLFMVGSHPLVRVQPSIPMKYASKNWDFGWLMLRTDGRMVYRRCDPHTLKFSDIDRRHAIRWFVR